MTRWIFFCMFTSIIFYNDNFVIFNNIHFIFKKHNEYKREYRGWHGGLITRLLARIIPFQVNKDYRVKV